MNAIQKIAANDGEFVGAFRQNVIRVIGSYRKTEEDNEYEQKIKEKQQEMIALISENAEAGTYNEEFDKRYQAIAEEIGNLKELQMEERWNKKLAENYEQRVKEMDVFLQSASTQELSEFDDDLVRRLVERVMIQFKSGIVMEEKL